VSALTDNHGLLPVSNIIIVLPIPAPIRLMFLFVNDTAVAYVQDPAGIDTVSPSADVSIAD